MRRLGLSSVAGKIAVTLAALLACGGGGVFVMKQGGAGKIAAWSHKLAAVGIDTGALLGMRLEKLTVEGREKTSREDLLSALDMEQGTPILSLDVEKARAAIEALPWVKQAQVERHLPDRVNIRLEERKPYALWQEGDRYTLVDHTGKSIVSVPQDQISEQPLPLIVGADAPRHAADLFAALETNPALAARVRAAVRVGERRWNLYLDSFENGMAVRLPEDGVGEAWTRLGALEHDYKILERDLDFVDLRLDDRLIVRVHKDSAAPTPKPATTKKPAPAAPKQNT